LLASQQLDSTLQLHAAHARGESIELHAGSAEAQDGGAFSCSISRQEAQQAWKHRLGVDLDVILERHDGSENE